jgi:hypothetical protein
MSLSLHGMVVCGRWEGIAGTCVGQREAVWSRYQESGQERGVLGAAWEGEVREGRGEERAPLTGLHLVYPGLLIFYVEVHSTAHWTAPLLSGL